MAKTYINVPFEEKDEAKALGAMWDKKKKSWFIPDNIDKANFSKWQKTKAKSSKPKKRYIDDMSTEEITQMMKDAISRGEEIVLNIDDVFKNQ